MVNSKESLDNEEKIDAKESLDNEVKMVNSINERLDNEEKIDTKESLDNEEKIDAKESLDNEVKMVNSINKFKDAHSTAELDEFIHSGEQVPTSQIDTHLSLEAFIQSKASDKEDSSRFTFNLNRKFAVQNIIKNKNQFPTGQTDTVMMKPNATSHAAQSIEGVTDYYRPLTGLKALRKKIHDLHKFNRVMQTVNDELMQIIYRRMMLIDWKQIEMAKADVNVEDANDNLLKRNLKNILLGHPYLSSFGHQQDGDVYSTLFEDIIVEPKLDELANWNDHPSQEFGVADVILNQNLYENRGCTQTNQSNLKSGAGKTEIIELNVVTNNVKLCREFTLVEHQILQEIVCVLVFFQILFAEYKLAGDSTMKNLLSGFFGVLTKIYRHYFTNFKGRKQLFQKYYAVHEEIFINAILSSRGCILKQSVLHPGDCRRIPVLEEEYLGRLEALRQMIEETERLRNNLMSNFNGAEYM